MAGSCSGNGNDHCCYIAGKVCPFLEENTVPGRRWACGLRRELGSWNAVHSDPRYIENVRSRWNEINLVDCGDWPNTGETCGVCGTVGT